MNFILLILTLAQPQPAEVPSAVAAREVIAAERAFAARAQSEGQWTAFRATAAPEAIMLTPDPTPVREFLARFASDPAVAVMWWPSRVWVSCDGTLAVTTGPWVRNGGTRVGTFTTIWQRQADGGWRWVYDNGRDTPRAVEAPDVPTVEPVFCGEQSAGTELTAADPPDVQFEGRALNDGRKEWASLRLADGIARGRSADNSISWNISRVAGRGANAYQLTIFVRARDTGRVALVELHGLEPARTP